MNERNQKENPALVNATHTVGALKRASDSGKAAGLAKGAAAGPYGMIAAGLLESRQLLSKILASVLSIFLLPVLFILMLPSLIFGGFSTDNSVNHSLSSSNLIMANIEEAEVCIESTLNQKHNTVISRIHADAATLGTNHEYSITDSFSDTIIYESTQILSQFCASQDDYTEINIKKLESLLQKEADNIFTYTVSTHSWEKIDTASKKMITIYHHEYIVEYAGDTYFAENVFHLTPEQADMAEAYASNLHMFLYDTVYYVETNPDLQPGEAGNAAVDTALTMLGTPYSQELRSQPGYFDCSSLTYWIYSQLGISLSYEGSDTAAAQGRYITENNLAVAYADLAPGDLIFYSLKINNRYLNISHVAIYAGNGYIIDASSTEQKVVYRPIFNTSQIVLCGRPYVSQ